MTTISHRNQSSSIILVTSCRSRPIRNILRAMSRYNELAQLHSHRNIAFMLTRRGGEEVGEGREGEEVGEGGEGEEVGEGGEGEEERMTDRVG